MPKLHEVIKRQMEAKGLEPVQVASLMGISQRMVEYYLKGTKKPSANRLMELCKILDIKFSDINEPKVPNKAIHEYIKQTESTYQDARRDMKISGKYEPIPIYDVDIAASNLELYDDNTNGVQDYYYIPEFSGCRAFNVYADSMEPLISKGAKIFAKKIENWKEDLEFGQVYSVGMIDGRRYLKYIKKSKDDDKFLLRSENDHYDDFEILKKNIRSVWLVDGWMNKHTQSTFFVLKLDKNGKMKQ